VLTMDKARRVASTIAKLLGNAQPVFCE
jgi:hypothetical protein